MIRLTMNRVPKLKRNPLTRAGTLSAFLLLTATAALAAGPKLLTQPSKSPLVNFRIVIHSGAAADPADKAGLAALTSALLSKGGTKERSYDAIVEALFPMASSVGAQIDKEVTIFQGTTHRENLDAYYEILRSMLLEPGLREDDYRRLKDELSTSCAPPFAATMKKSWPRNSCTKRSTPATPTAGRTSAASPRSKP